MLAMMADNIEHVISYWIIFQKFHSPALAGFAVLSHWLPFLLFSVAVGGLAAMPAVASVIAGATKPEQVAANVAAGEWVPSADDLAALKKLR
jgi:hypothetical protein